MVPHAGRDEVSKASSYLYENNYTQSNTTIPPLDQTKYDELTDDGSTERSPPLHEREKSDKFLFDTSV